MDSQLLLQWHYMIYLLPFAIATLFLALTSIRLGGHRSAGQGRHASGGHGVRYTGGHGHRVGGHGHVHHSAHSSGSAPHPQTHHTHTHTPSQAHTARSQHSQKGATGQEGGFLGALLGMFGIGRAPTSLVLSLFGLLWGFCGVWANQLLLKTPNPTLNEMLPSLCAAMAGSLVGTRLLSEMIARLLPKEETSAVSHHELFGLTGKVVFPVNESEGRVYVYDENGTLHDERCRVASGHLPIPRDRRVMITDIDTQGRLVVEEIS